MKSKILSVSFIIIILWIFGFVVGRLTGPKPQPFDITLAPEESVPEGGGGILTPESPVAQVTPSPGLLSRSDTACGIDIPTWHRFSDPYLAIRVRALQADSIHYTFKKKWFNFPASTPIPLQLSVYGVAPESVRVQGTVPEPRSKNFFLILTCTTLPSANILFGYKNFLLHFQYHLQTTLDVDVPRSSPYAIGIGYHLKF